MKTNKGKREKLRQRNGLLYHLPSDESMTIYGIEIAGSF